MRRITLVLSGVLVAGLVSLGGQSAEPTKPADLMRRKLDQSQKVLEGVALSDFGKISRHAEELIEISKAAEWKALKTREYEIYSNDFRRTAEALIKSAKDKNLDAAALHYVDLTLTCVKCHKHVREIRMARVD